MAGNIRELKNVVERAVIRSKNGTACMPLHFDFGKAGDRFALSTTHPGCCPFPADVTRRTLEEMGDRYVEWMLAYARGKIAGRDGAAERLGVHPNTVGERLRRKKVHVAEKNELMMDTYRARRRCWACL